MNSAGLAALLIPAAGLVAQEGPTQPNPPLDLVSGKPVALPSAAPGDRATAATGDVCDRYAAPFFRGSGGFVVEPKDGRIAGVTVQSGDESVARTVYAGRNGLVVDLLASPLCTGPNGIAPAQCQVSFSGVKGGGWYWVNGDRNAAVAPLVCQDDLGGGPAPLDPGGVQTLPSRWGTGTLFVHDTQGLMGIVPQLSPTGRGASPSCERYVAPFFRGSGGFVAKPEAGQAAEVVIERGSSTARKPIAPRSDGLSVQLVSDSLCTDANGEPAECRVSLTGIEGGGWYWVNGDRNAAVAPLVCEGRLAGSPAVVPGGVRSSRAAFGTGSLFVHETQRLMGIVPHLPDTPDEQEEVEVRVSVFGGGTVEVLGGEALACPTSTLCAGTFPAAGSVTLRAVAPADYAFDRWDGCDSVSDDRCVVALHENRELSVDFLSTQPLTLKDNVVTFDRNRLDDIQRYDPQSGLMVLAAGANADDIGVGSVLVSSVVDPGRHFESYFLRRVTGIRRLAGAPAYIKTATATLDDLIESGSLAMRPPLGAEAVSSYVLPSGIVPTSHPASDMTVRELSDDRWAFDVAKRAESPDRVAAPSSRLEQGAVVVTPPPKSHKFTITDYPIKTAAGNEIGKANGTLEIVLSTEFLLDAGWTGIDEFMAKAHVGAVAKLTVTLGAKLTKEETYSLPINFTFLPVAVGPVVITPSLEADLVLNLTLESALESTLKWGAGRFAGAHYRNGSWDGLWGGHMEEPKVTVPTELKATATAEVGVAFKVSTRVYSVAGPQVSVEPYFGVSMFLTGLDSECNWDYEAYLGARASLGGGIKVIAWGLEYNQDIWDGRLHTFPIGNPACGDRDHRQHLERDVQLDAPSSLRFSSARSKALTVEWDRAGGGGTGYPITYELDRTWSYPRDGREPVPSSRRFQVDETTLADVLLLPETQYCYSVRSVAGGIVRSDWSTKLCGSTLTPDVTPPSAPGQLAAEAKSAGVIVLEWSASRDDRAVDHYVVAQRLETPGGEETFSVGSTSLLSYNVTTLEPSTEYCFSVTAVDEDGNLSDVSGIACATTPESSAWRFRIACRGEDYQVEGLVDLDEAFVKGISVLGEGEDYNGKKLGYALTGPYDLGTGVFDGTIDWTFEGSADWRRDTFKANLLLNDTGDIATTKSGPAANCDAVIRFDRQDTTATSASTSSSARSRPWGGGEGVTFARF